MSEGGFQMRLFYNDYYFQYLNKREENTLKIHQETSQIFPERPIKRIPVLRFFGQTKRGQQACVNIFDYFPYMYVEFPAILLDPQGKSQDDIQVFLQYFAQCLELAIYIVKGSKRDASSEMLDKLQDEIFKNNEQFVHNVSFLKQFPIYGFSQKQINFLKIEFYDPFTVKIASNILREGGVLGVKMQPYEAHLSWHTHFFKDFCLGGNEFINIMEFSFRHLPNLKLDDLKQKTHFPQVFKAAADKLLQSDEDYYFLQESIDLQMWHSGMASFLNKSPYERATFSDIEIDCNACDILNYLVKPGDVSRFLSYSVDLEQKQSQREISELPSINIPTFVKREKKQKTSVEQPKARNESVVKVDPSAIQKAFQNRYGARSGTSFTSESIESDFSSIEQQQKPLQPLQLLKRRTVAPQIEIAQKPKFSSLFAAHDQSNILDLDAQIEQKLSVDKSQKSDLISRSSGASLRRTYEQEKQFMEYTKDIKEVRSLVNLWSDEFERRILSEKPPMEKVQKDDGSREGGFTEALQVKMERRVQSLFDKHIQKLQVLPQTPKDLYKEMPSLDFETLVSVINTREKPNELQNVERWQLLGMHSMKHYQDTRFERALEKELQGFTEEEEEGSENLETLDVMTSLKNQYANIKQRQLDQRSLKKSSKTKIMEQSVKSNTRITNFFNQKQDKGSVMDDLENFDIKESLLDIASPNKNPDPLSMIKEANEEVCSEDQDLIFDDDFNNEDFSFPLESVVNESPSKPLKFQDQQKREEINDFDENQIHFLHGDKITQIPNREFTNIDGHINHQLAFYDNKEDMNIHLNYMMLMRTKRVTSDDLTGLIEFKNIQENKELENKFWGSYETLLIGKQRAPSALMVQGNYRENFEQKRVANDHNVSPATQYYLKQFSENLERSSIKPIPMFKTCELNKNREIRRLNREFQDEMTSCTVMALELQIQTRYSYAPNWVTDPISAVMITIDNPCAQLSLQSAYKKVNVLLINQQTSRHIPEPMLGIRNEIHHCILARDEIDLFAKLIDVFTEHDPDVILGWETEILSIGYLCKRAEFGLGFKFFEFIQRQAKTFKPFNQQYYRKRAMDNQVSRDSNLPGWSSKNAIRAQQQDAVAPEVIKGRVVINVWRYLRTELQLTNYDLENVSYHVLKRRLSTFSTQTLQKWWTQGQRFFCQTIDHLFSRVHTMFDIMDKLDLVNRDMNMAKVYGIDYESVMTRGSQFRVEAILSKICRSMEHFLLSASPQQVKDQNQLEVIPLVIEPDKKFYTDPVVVVDFQSLYPSVIIAYNICYSTCLGKIEKVQSDKRKLGVYHISGNIKQFFGYKADQELTKAESKQIFDDIIIAPNLNCFVKPHIKRGILPKMLSEILNTRIMVKKSMKLYDKKEKTYKMLHSRQLALKLIANVTYGYTAAGFSGRMPSVEIADSVVGFGRQTLESVCNLVSKREKVMGTKVVYGDTDSLFILCQGSSLEGAFKIGKDLAAEVTKMNPFPMELKFEKVYFPCVMLAKKRYCGYMYENLGDKPVLDAKGIEVIRRDGVEALRKIQDKCLRLLFESKNLSEVKRYLIKQWSKICSGQVDYNDLLIAKEVKLGGYKSEASMSKGAIVAERNHLQDPGYIAKDRERVAYIIVNGQEAGTKQKMTQKNLAVSPEELVRSQGALTINSEYYIRKLINPAINRIFEAIFEINVDVWYDNMPKQLKKPINNHMPKKVDTLQGIVGSKSLALTQNQSKTLSNYFHVDNCFTCEQPIKGKSNNHKICSHCQKHQHISEFVKETKIQDALNEHESLNKICLKCCSQKSKGLNQNDAAFGPLILPDIEDLGNTEKVPCSNFYCQIYYKKQRAVNSLLNIYTMQDI